jgi:hypothetical protein
MDFDVGRLTGLYTADPVRVDAARRRQAAVWRGEKPDQWPAIAQTQVLTESQQAIPNPDFKQAFESVEMMLCSQVRQACGVANTLSDAVPSVRGNYGTGTTLSCLGLDQEVFADKMPWLKRHLTREQAARLTPADIRLRGAAQCGMEYMRRHKAVMGDRPMLYCMDTQGPFDLAHLMIGDDLFLLVYDDPPFVHHVLEFCVELATQFTQWMKAVSGEPAHVCHHTNSLYMENGGVRICEDSTTLLGPDQIREFAMPYSQRLARRFGGAWVHYCGRNDALTRAILEVPEFRGINFGHVAGHEYDHPFEQDMSWIRESGKVFFGWWPRLPDERGEAYLRRMLEWSRQGCLIPQIDPAVGSGGYPDIRAAVDAWYALQ